MGAVGRFAPSAQQRQRYARLRRCSALVLLAWPPLSPRGVPPPSRASGARAPKGCRSLPPMSVALSSRRCGGRQSKRRALWSLPLPGQLPSALCARLGAGVRPLRRGLLAIWRQSRPSPFGVLRSLDSRQPASVEQTRRRAALRRLPAHFSLLRGFLYVRCCFSRPVLLSAALAGSVPLSSCLSFCALAVPCPALLLAVCASSGRGSARRSGFGCCSWRPVRRCPLRVVHAIENPLPGISKTGRGFLWLHQRCSPKKAMRGGKPATAYMVTTASPEGGRRFFRSRSLAA